MGLGPGWSGDLGVGLEKGSGSGMGVWVRTLVPMGGGSGRGSKIDGRCGGRRDSGWWMVLYLSCTICVSTVCLWAW